jgi:phage/plasmid primase-like uncharacterized protein
VPDLLDEYTRVRYDFRCPVCGKDSWCLVAVDGTSAICQRCSSDRRVGDAGWKHIFEESIDVPKNATKKPIKKSVADLAGLHSQYTNDLDCVGQLKELAYDRGLNWMVLLHMGVGWDGEALTFPMRDATGTITGFRRRFPDGTKRSVVGSRDGLFYAEPVMQSDVVLVCEGPTDTLAAMHLDFAAIGRPSCQGCVEETIAMLDRMKAEHVVIIADNDAPGRKGAVAMSNALLPHVPRVTVISPRQHKDLAEYVAEGAPRSAIESIMESGDDNTFLETL